MNRYVFPTLSSLVMLAACEKSVDSPDPSAGVAVSSAQDRQPAPDPDYTATRPANAPSDPQAATDLVTHDLQGTRWVPLRIAGQDVIPNEQRHEQYVVLEPGRRHVVGNAGCNRLRGSYTLDGDSLVFSQLSTTRMACPDLDRETALLTALESTASWRIEGAHLELFDGDGAALARFESRNL